MWVQGIKPKKSGLAANAFPHRATSLAQLMFETSIHVVLNHRCHIMPSKEYINLSLRPVPQSLSSEGIVNSSSFTVLSNILSGVRAVNQKSKGTFMRRIWELPWGKQIVSAGHVYSTLMVSWYLITNFP